MLESTPLSRKHGSNRRMMVKSGEHYSDDECNMDKTLNRSLNEYDIMEESYMSEEHSAVLPKVIISSSLAIFIFEMWILTRCRKLREIIITVFK